MFILPALFLLAFTGLGFLLSLCVMIRAAFAWKKSLTARVSLFIVLAAYAFYGAGMLLTKFITDSGDGISLGGIFVLLLLLSGPALCWLAAALSGADWLNVKLTDYFRGSVEPPKAWPSAEQKRDEQ